MRRIRNTSIRRPNYQVKRANIIRLRRRWNCSTANYCFSHSLSWHDVAYVNANALINADDFENAKDTFAVCPLRFRVPVSSNTTSF